MDNKCFISKLLKGFVVMSIHVTYGIKRKKDRSHSGLQIIQKPEIIQKPRFSEKPSAPQTRWLCRAEKAMDLLSIFASTVETPKGTILEDGLLHRWELFKLLYLSSRGPIRRQTQPSHPPATPPGVCQGNPSQVRWHLNCLGSLVTREVAMS